MIRWRHKLRLIIVAAVILMLFGAIEASLYRLQIVPDNRITERVEKQHRSKTMLYPRRGTIYDRTGKKILAESRRLKSVFVNPSIINDPKKTKDPEAVIKILSEILQLDINTVRSRASAKTADGKYGGEVLLERKLQKDKIKKIEELLTDEAFFSGVKNDSGKPQRKYFYQGIYFRDRDERAYPSETVLCHVLGYMQDKDLQDKDEANNKIIRDDIKPQRGIELSYDKFLRGKEGWRVSEVDKRGRDVVSEKTRELPAVDGYDVILSIDLNIQYILEEEIAKAVKDVEFDSCIGIIMDPYTGEVLAMASYPNFNSNKITEIIANHSIETVYEPGSTLKAITGCVALESGVVSMDMQFDCENGSWRIPGGPLHDAHGYGILSFREIIEKSSNIGIAKVALLVGEKGIYENLINFGFNAQSGIGLNEEKSGYLAQMADWSKRTIYMLAMGQEISVTSLQLANAFCTIANGGKLMKPLLVTRIEDENHIPVEEYKPEVIRQVVSKETTDKIKIALADVVSESGTARLADIKGYTEGGKTGTAQKVIDGRYSDRIFDSTFVGFSPVDRPRVVMLICMNATKKPNHYAGTVAGPVFARVGERVLKYLEVPYDAPEELEKTIEN
jgi:cell division protein FtsI (penicillin-binding protein 3)